MDEDEEAPVVSFAAQVEFTALHTDQEAIWERYAAALKAIQEERDVALSALWARSHAWAEAHAGERVYQTVEEHPDYRPEDR